MKKIISKRAFIRNMLNRAINGDEQYQLVREKMRAYNCETARIKCWSDSTDDLVIRSKIEHYLHLTDELTKEIKKLPVVKDVNFIGENREWAENLVRGLALYPRKGKDLKHVFAQIIFSYEKWLNLEINARNI